MRKFSSEPKLGEFVPVDFQQQAEKNTPRKKLRNV